ncbi:unnamed protein product [Urochloa humidicola]
MMPPASLVVEARLCNRPPPQTPVLPRHLIRQCRSHIQRRLRMRPPGFNEVAGSPLLLLLLLPNSSGSFLASSVPSVGRRVRTVASAARSSSSRIPPAPSWPRRRRRWGSGCGTADGGVVEVRASERMAAAWERVGAAAYGAGVGARVDRIGGSRSNARRSTPRRARPPPHAFYSPPLDLELDGFFHELAFGLSGLRPRPSSSLSRSMAAAAAER